MHDPKKTLNTSVIYDDDYTNHQECVALAQTLLRCIIQNTTILLSLKHLCTVLGTVEA